MPLNEESFIARVALRHSLSPEAVRPILRALRSGGGSMSQFRCRRFHSPERSDQFEHYTVSAASPLSAASS
jgi:hypothetical protein